MAVAYTALAFFFFFFFLAFVCLIHSVHSLFSSSVIPTWGVPTISILTELCPILAIFGVGLTAPIALFDRGPDDGAMPQQGLLRGPPPHTVCVIVNALWERVGQYLL